MTKTAAIADAIERKRMLRLDDHGKSRTVIPHILGLAGTGNLALKGFSLPWAGPTAARPAPARRAPTRP